jgi:leader peptidase (prepilin peptidase)/N-methyltransferase
VSARYPATELLCAIVYVAIVAVYGLTLQSLELVAFASILLFLSLTDLDCHRIPDACILAAVGVRAAYLIAQAAMGVDVIDEVIASLVGAAALGIGVLLIVLVADRVLGRESMGWGDVKLFAVAGLYFGWQQGLFLVAISCFVGLLFSLVALSTPEKPAEGGDDLDGEAAETPAKSSSRLIPFGPSIAVACIITMFAGQAFVGWYASLF